jgi:hypothetical protein
MREMYQRSGPIGMLAAQNGPMAFVLGPDACGAALQNVDKAFVNGWQGPIGPFFDRGLMLLDGAEHLRHRRILQQAFARDRIEAYAAALHPGDRPGTGRLAGRAGFHRLSTTQEADPQPAPRRSSWAGTGSTPPSLIGSTRPSSTACRRPGPAVGVRAR